jgi:hypothetical protein
VVCFTRCGSPLTRQVVYATGAASNFNIGELVNDFLFLVEIVAVTETKRQRVFARLVSFRKDLPPLLLLVTRLPFSLRELQRYYRGLIGFV